MRNNIIRDFDELSLNDLFLSNNGILKIKKENVIFHLKLYLKKNTETLIAFSNGARDPKKSSPPFFSRSTWQNQINSNCIYIDDPTLHNTNLRVGWGIGNKNHYYLNSISEIIKKITTFLNISSNNVIYFGSSAGGFMSVMLSSLHKDSSSIVNNPQFYVAQERITKFVKDIHPNINEKDIEKIFGNRFSFYKFYKKNDYFPQIIYILNRLSKVDIERQYRPFKKFLDEYPEYNHKIEFLQYHSPGGHGAMYDSAKTIGLINAVIQEKNHQIILSKKTRSQFSIYNHLDQALVQFKFDDYIYLPLKYFKLGNYAKMNFTYQNTAGMLKLSILSKYTSTKGKNILRYEILKNNQVLSHEDMASWNKNNDINIYNLKKGDTISIKVITMKDRLKKSWVSASTLEVINYEEIPMEEPLDKLISFNSPFMDLSQTVRHNIN